jgi:two-component system response regulator HydG
MSTPTVLLVTRTPSVIEAIQGISNTIPHLQLEVCPGDDRACAKVRRPDVALVLAHASVGADGEISRLLWAVASARRPCATLVLSETYKEHQAAALLRAGAADYLELPADLPRLAHLLDALTHRLRPAAAPDATRPPAPEPLAGVVADGLEGMLEQVRRVAPQETTLLLTGQTGTGKTRLARLIHELSPRRHEPFLVIDCGALSPTLIESELFGHVRGAFTGAERERAGKLAAAGRGTLLLDEVNSLPLPLQAKLLRAVDEHLFEPVGANRPLPLQARLIAASNVDLQAEVAAGHFREDLFYRLNVVAFFLPPLRERRSAIAPMAQRFLADFTSRNRPDVLGFSPGTLRTLEAYRWPGNVRELRNVIERAVALCPGPLVEPDDLPEALRGEEPVSPPAAASFRPVTTGLRSGPLHQSTEEAEVRRIREALHKNGNNRLRAAQELGISRVALYKKLHKYGLMEPRFWAGQGRSGALTG